MTYLEKYRSCSSWEELKEKMERDITIAAFIYASPERVDVIKKAGEKVVTEKGWWEDNNRGEE